MSYVFCVAIRMVLALIVVLVEGTSAPADQIWNSTWAKQSIDCQRTNWIHTAKTGSTFCLAIQHVCCPDAFQTLTGGITTEMLSYAFGSPQNRSRAGFRYDSQYCYKFLRDGYAPINCTFAGRPEHLPLHPKTDLTQRMSFLIVREPKSRIISAFLDGVHLEGFTNRSAGYEMRFMFNDMNKDKQLSREEKLLRQARMYAHHHALYGHQVKMLLGLPVVDLSKPHPRHIKATVALAVERMRQFFFVGIFDEYARSLRLFHELANVGEYCLNE